jgi:uncharacterized membrane protein
MYDNAAAADADYEAVKDLHTKAGVIDAYDAAVIERRADGKVKITKKHETPTRVGGRARRRGGAGHRGGGQAGDEAGTEDRGQASDG